jgi:hypothetical protein
LFLKCPANAKTIYNNSIKPGFIHIKSVGELLFPNSKTLHQQCFESITSGNKDDFLMLGFSFDYDLYSIKFNSSTFNLKLSQYFNESNDREGMEFFTPILQTAGMPRGGVGGVAPWKISSGKISKGGPR